VIPLNSDSAVEFGFPVERNAFIILFEDGDEMVGMFDTNVFDSEIVDY
jgi:hypothetical protein